MVRYNISSNTYLASISNYTNHNWLSIVSKKSMLFFVLALTSCVSPEKSSTKLNPNIKYDSIPIGADQLAFYYRYEIIDRDGEMFVIAANHADQCIDLFFNGNFEEKIVIPLEGPEAVTGSKSIGNFRYIEGSIFIPSRFYGFKSFDLANKEQKIFLTSDDLNLGSYQTGNGMTFTQYQTANISKDKKYTVFQVWHSEVTGNGSKKVYLNKYANTAIVDLQNKKIDMLQIPYPEINNFEAISFGHLDLMTYEFIDDHRLLVAFQNSPELRIVDIKDKIIVNKTPAGVFEGFPTARTLSSSEAMDFDRRTDHYFKEPQYFQIGYDPYRKWIYRVYKSKTEERTIFDYSQNRLLIMDLNFNILYNEKLDPSIYPMLFPYKDGLVGLVKDVKTEQYLKLAFLKFE